ncbi:MAG: hypothetical protein HC799_19130 [Limnothrix sp. RL_2_0]|nr:hypothetical protein [Limnothrix sp. RL_2_0]
MVENSELHLAIQGAIAKVDQEMSIQQVAAASNLNPRTIEQLFQMGQFEAYPATNPTRQEPLLVRGEEAPNTYQTRLSVLETPVERLDSYQLANAIARGLITHPNTPYRSQLYLRYQTMIRSLRAGSTPTQAAQQSNLQLAHVKLVLENAGVSPEAAGL